MFCSVISYSRMKVKYVFFLILTQKIPLSCWSCFSQCLPQNRYNELQLFSLLFFVAEQQARHVALVMLSVWPTSHKLASYLLLITYGYASLTQINWGCCGKSWIMLRCIYVNRRHKRCIMYLLLFKNKIKIHNALNISSWWISTQFQAHRFQ